MVDMTAVYGVMQFLSDGTASLILKKIIYIFIHRLGRNIQANKQQENRKALECGPMPNLMVALPNIGGALCSTP